MTNKELLDKIREEIDKRYAEYREKMKSDDFTYYEGMADALDLFEQFLDSLESEKPINLEEEVKRYYSDNFAYLSSDQPTLSILTNIARHFTDWQKEQMLKEAVEWMVTTNLANRPVIYLDQLKGFQYGDKVRIIIVKE